MTGSAGWSYFAATRYILGIRPNFDALHVDPCVSQSWKKFSISRTWRGAEYKIEVENPTGVSKGVKECRLNGATLPKANANMGVIPAQKPGSINQITVVMG
jgi:N,N'-diacetylchitobiose phosphorylase